MLKHLICVKLRVALALTSVVLVARSASGQSSPALPDSQQKNIAAPKGFRSDNPELAASVPAPQNRAAADQPKSNDVEAELAAMKAETAAVRELLIKMQEQQ